MTDLPSSESHRKPATSESAAGSIERRPEFGSELAAEAITVRIRWFGLFVGYALVNFSSPAASRPVLNAILTLGAVFTLIDTWHSLRGRVFLSKTPLLVSLMEAVFIGLLCKFDEGYHSPFRFYYFLSILVCAIRYWPWITYSTFALHAISYGVVVLVEISASGVERNEAWSTLLLMIVLMGWVTWASTGLAGLVKKTNRRMAELNDELKVNQALLEERIEERTRELQESQALLVQQEKHAAFGLLAAGIAHEVGNPLAAISSLVQMLNRQPTDEYTRERLNMVDDQLLRIQRTLRELVNFGRPANTAVSRCDIHEVIQVAIDISKYYKRKKGKQIVTRFADNLTKPRMVRDQMVQVFLNLILNALDATEEGGEIEIRTKCDGACIKISVKDNGHGILPEEREGIFQPYFTTKPTGTGLGLFVCQHIMQQSPNGRIELEQTSDRGSVFAVYLDCEEAERGEHPSASNSEETRSTPTSKEQELTQFDTATIESR